MIWYNHLAYGYTPHPHPHPHPTLPPPIPTPTHSNTHPWQLPTNFICWFYCFILLLAFGCSNPTLPAGGFLDRHGDQAIITCKSNNVQWEIICRDGQWHGDVGECTGSKYTDICTSYIGQFGWIICCIFLTVWCCNVWLFGIVSITPNPATNSVYILTYNNATNPVSSIDAFHVC